MLEFWDRFQIVEKDHEFVLVGLQYSACDPEMESPLTRYQVNAAGALLLS